ncbi:MAG TPA: 50S ribosomal protein L22 [Cyclobacteriaceae bacterium]|nr:50S ribosomal protein L22 [Cyclobacteriaceae bacterium]
MEAVAKLKNVPTSPRKMRMVADLIRGQKVNQALNLLKFQPNYGASKLEKLLLSAISNWQNKHEDVKIEDADLFIKEIFVDGGRMMKRVRPAPQGRAYRVRKRSNHVTLIVASRMELKPEPKAEPKPEKKVETAPEGKKKKTKKKV